MVTFQTKYHGPTNTRGARISCVVAAHGATKRVSIPFPHDKSEAAAHFEAVCKYVKQNEMLYLGGKRVAAGDTKDGYSFVFVDSETFEF